jgi:hypothetical protein
VSELCILFRARKHTLDLLYGAHDLIFCPKESKQQFRKIDSQFLRLQTLYSS